MVVMGVLLMIVTMEHIEILDVAEQLINKILQSEVMHDYQQAQITLKQDKEAQQLIREFTYIKEQHEDIERFGRYHPDYTKLMKEIRSTKRAMDLHESVAAYKIAERNIQRLLDEVSEIIAKSVSEHIMVPKEDGLYADQSCSSGGCGTGASCGCQVS